MKERITIIMTMLLLGVVLVFTNSSTVEAKSKLKKSTTVTVKTLNKSTVKKVDKAFRSAKVVKVKVKASSKKKARKTMTKLNVKLCEYTEIDVYCLETYNCKKQGSYYVFENKSATTKIYRENSAIYLTFDKINTKIAEKIHNIMLEQSQISGKSRRDITIAIKAKNKKEGLQKRNELFAKIGECNIYGFLPTYVSADRGYYDKDAGLYYDTFSEEDEKNYYYGMQLVQTLLDSRKAKWQAEIDNGNITAERAAELQQRINTNFCDYSTALKYYVLEPIWHCNGTWCHYDYIKEAELGYIKIEDVPEATKAYIEELQSKQTVSDFQNMYNKVWTGVCMDYADVERKMFKCLGWSSKDLSAARPRPDHKYSVIKVTNSDGVTGWVHCDYGTFNIKVNGSEDYATDYKWN